MSDKTSSWVSGKILTDILLSGSSSAAIRTVTDDLLFEEQALSQSISLCDIDFQGVVSFKAASLRGLELKRCRFRHELDLSAARLDGELTLTDCEFDQDATTLQHPQLSMQRIEIAGDARITIVSPRLVLTLNQAQINGNLHVSGLRQMESLTLRHATIGADVDIVGEGGALASDPEHYGAQSNIDCAHARIGGSVRLWIDVGDSIDFSKAAIAGTCSIEPHDSIEDADEQHCHIGNQLGFDDASIGGDLLLTSLMLAHLTFMNCRIAGAMEICEIDCAEGAVDGSHCQIGNDLHLSYVRAETLMLGQSLVGNAIVTVVSCQFNEINLYRVQTTYLMLNISGLTAAQSTNLSATALQAPMGLSLDCGRLGHLTLVDAVLGDSDFCADRIEQLHIAKSRIGSLTLSNTRQIDSVELRTVTIEGTLALNSLKVNNLSIYNSSISEDLLLSNILVRGTLNLSETHIAGRLTTTPVAQESGDSLTKAASLLATGLECQGDVDLCNLALEGDLLLNRVSVTGELRIMRPTAKNSRCFAHIPGRLDLGGATIGHLVLSGDSFPGNSPLLDDGISLERARIGRLEISDPLPKWIDIDDLRVDRFDIPKGDFTLLLKNTLFRRSSYASIEAKLRNDGQEDLAAEVYCTMRRRAIDEQRPGLPARAWDRFLDWTTAYGTAPSRLLWVMVVLLVGSVILFANPANISPSVEALEVLGDTVDQTTVPESWGTGSATWMALRYQIPIVPLFTEWEWMPSDRPLALPFNHQLAWLSMEDYAMWLALLHWIAWPLYLASVAGFVRRG